MNRAQHLVVIKCLGYTHALGSSFPQKPPYPLQTSCTSYVFSVPQVAAASPAAFACAAKGPLLQLLNMAPTPPPTPAPDASATDTDMTPPAVGNTTLLGTNPNRLLSWLWVVHPLLREVATATSAATASAPAALSPSVVLLSRMPPPALSPPALSQARVMQPGSQHLRCWTAWQPCHGPLSRHPSPLSPHTQQRMQQVTRSRGNSFHMSSSLRVRMCGKTASRSLLHACSTAPLTQLPKTKPLHQLQRTVSQV